MGKNGFGPLLAPVGPAFSLTHFRQELKVELISGQKATSTETLKPYLASVRHLRGMTSLQWGLGSYMLTQLYAFPHRI